MQHWHEQQLQALNRSLELIQDKSEIIGSPHNKNTTFDENRFSKLFGETWETVKTFFKELWKAGSQSLERLRLWIKGNLMSVKNGFVSIKAFTLDVVRKIVKGIKITKKVIVKMIKVGAGLIRGFGLDSLKHYAQTAYTRVSRAYRDVKANATAITSNVVDGINFLLILFSYLPHIGGAALILLCYKLFNKVLSFFHV